MTLPTNIILPLRLDAIREGDPEKIAVTMRNLVDTLTQMYQDLANNLNGYITTWTPTSYGLTSSGICTYSRQIGWMRRSGIITELWMDIAWTGHTGTGGLAIEMPYVAAPSEGAPWIGTIASDGNTFGAGYTYLTWSCEPSTTQGTIYRNGSGVALSAMSIAATGSYRGYIQYLGNDE